MFSARKAKPAARHPQQSVAPQIESSTTGSSRQIERSTTGSSLDDSNESSRRGDVALCCAYVLQGSDWAPVNNSRPDDLSGESRFLAAKIVQDDDMAEAFLELHDYPQTTIIELVVKLKAESRLVKLGGARNAKAHVYELERCCGPDVVALQFADDKAADNFGRAIRRAASSAAERRASFTDADALIRRCVDAGFEARDVREAVAAGAGTRIAVANYIFGKDSPERPRRPSLDQKQLQRFEQMGFDADKAAAALESNFNDEREALRRLLTESASGAEASAAAAAVPDGDATPLTPRRGSSTQASSSAASSYDETATLASSALPTVTTKDTTSTQATSPQQPTQAVGRPSPQRTSALPPVTEEAPAPTAVRKPTKQAKATKVKQSFAGRLQSLFRTKKKDIAVKKRPALPRGVSGAAAELSAAAEAVAAKRASLNEKGKVTFDDFEPLKLLGVGGFGSVLLVRKKDGKQLFALKVMKKATYAKNRLSEHAFFERNLMLVARHTFLVRLRYAFQSRRDLYLVTDYFAGGSLEDALKRVEDRRGLGRDAARFIIAELSLGLDYLHARDVLHRDIKAANVLLDTEGHAHLCDFGLAKCVENNNQGPKRSFAGTVEYMAPELLRKGDEAPSPALDWWALGVLLVETCQGKTPFRASTPRQLMLNIIREAPQIIGDDEKFRSAVEKLLHKRASRRLRSAAQLAKRRFFEPLDFAKLERKELQPPFTPRAGRVPNVPDQGLVKKFGPHRPSDGDSPAKEGGSDEVSLSFKGEQFQGFSVFASPAPPVRRKSSKDLK